MFSKLDEVESRYEEVNMALQRPDIASNQTQYRALMKELGNLEKIVLVYREYKTKVKSLKSSKELLTAEQDSEMRELIREEVKELEVALPDLEQQLKHYFGNSCGSWRR
jgi:peptide chain release factor 1